MRLAVLAIAVLLPASVSASEQVVVRGRVLSTRLLEPGAAQFTTVATVAVERVWEGPPGLPPVLEVVTPGGEDGELGQRVWGAAVLRPGARLLLWLAPEPGTGRFEVPEGADGALPVAEEDGRAYVRAGRAVVPEEPFLGLGRGEQPAADLLGLSPGPLVGGHGFVRSHPDDNPEIDLYWERRDLGFALNGRGSATAGQQASLGAVMRSFAAWSGARCTDLTFSLSITPREDTGFVPRGDNVNLVVFREARCDEPGRVPAGDPCWAARTCGSRYGCWQIYPKHTASTIASAVTYFHTRTGEIVDADIEINGGYFGFATDGRADAMDVQNVVTHEVGHVLGLDHSVAGTTMFESAFEGELAKRELSDDDVQGVCHIYPAGLGTNKSKLSVNSLITSGCSAGPGAVTWLACLSCVALLRRKRR